MLQPSSLRQKSEKSLLIRDLKDLKLVRRELEARARQEAQRLAALQAAAALARAEKELFSRAVGRVVALPPQHRPGHRASLERARPAPIAEQLRLDEMAVMQRSPVGRV